MRFPRATTALLLAAALCGSAAAEDSPYLYVIPAARLAKDCIREVKTLDYPELGMEAVWKIEVEDFPAFVVIDDKGNDFFAEGGQPLLTIGHR